MFWLGRWEMGQVKGPLGPPAPLLYITPFPKQNSHIIVQTGAAWRIVEPLKEGIRVLGGTVGTPGTKGAGIR